MTHKQRPYHQHGHGVVEKALPYLLGRVKDALIPEEKLSPVERAAREWRLEVLCDLGGAENVTATKMALLDAATGSNSAPSFTSPSTGLFSQGRGQTSTLLLGSEFVGGTQLYPRQIQMG